VNGVELLVGDSQDKSDRAFACVFAGLAIMQIKPRHASFMDLGSKSGKLVRLPLTSPCLHEHVTSDLFVRNLGPAEMYCFVRAIVHDYSQAPTRYVLQLRARDAAIPVQSQ
jgi:hypothetical protein